MLFDIFFNLSILAGDGVADFSIKLFDYQEKLDESLSIRVFTGFDDIFSSCLRKISW